MIIQPNLAPFLQQISCQLTQNNIQSLNNTQGLIIPYNYSLQNSNVYSTNHHLISQNNKNRQKASKIIYKKESAFSNLQNLTIKSSIKNPDQYRFHQKTNPQKKNSQKHMKDQHFQSNLLSIRNKHTLLATETQCYRVRTNKSSRKKSTSGRQNMFVRIKPKNQQIFYRGLKNDFKIFQDKNMFDLGNSITIKHLFLKQSQQNKAIKKKYLNRSLAIQQNDRSNYPSSLAARKIKNHL